MFPAMGLGIDSANTSLDDFLKKLRQTGAAPGGNALASLVGGAAAPAGNDLESQFGSAVDALPKLPSGDFYLPGANGGSNDLVPLTGGQPTAIFDQANRRDAFGGVGKRGVFPEGMAPNIISGVESTPLPNAPTWMGAADAGVPKGGAGPGDSAAKGDLSSLLAGAQVPDMAGPVGGKPSILDNLAGNSALTSMPGGVTMPAGLDTGAGKFMSMPDGSLRNVNNPAEEAAANTVFATQAAGGNPGQTNAILQQILGSGDEKFKAEQAAAARGGHVDIQKLANQGHLAVAQEASRSNQLAELDKMEAHIRDAVGKGAVDKFTGQTQIDFINKRRANLAANLGTPGGPPGQGAPPGAGGANSAVMSPSLSAGADLAQLRNLFGSVDPGSGRFTPNPQVGGMDINQLIDKVSPDQIPQIAAAMKAGSFGDPASLRNASLNSLAQNYLMSQGQLPGGKGQMPGMYTIPVQQNGKDVPLMSLLASPPSNLLDTQSQRARFATTGVPYDTIKLPDGTTVPFDAGGVQGLSEGASALGLNKGKLRQTGQRLGPLSQLILELQASGKVP